MVIPFLALASISFIFFLLRKEYLFWLRKPKMEKVAAETDLFFAELLFMDTSALSITDEIAQFTAFIPFHKKWCKNLVFNKLLDLNRNIEDLDISIVAALYRGLGFDIWSSYLLNQNEPHAKKQALQHFQSLGYSHQHPKVRSFLDNPDNEISMGSLLTLIRLTHNDLELLLHYKGPISKADEIKILDLMKRQPRAIPSDPVALLRVNNPDIICLGLKILAITKQPFSLQKVERLMRSPHKKIRLALIETIKENYILLANPILIAAFKRESSKHIKIAILDALGAIGDHRTQGFARVNLIRERDPDTRYALVKCINSLDRTYFKDLDNRYMPGLDAIQHMVKHLNDPMLG
jgi:hypothetical protein